MSNALVERSGLLGEVLQCVIDFESGSFTPNSLIALPEMLTAYREAIQWTERNDWLKAVA
jgi:hypothetical protein